MVSSKDKHLEIDDIERLIGSRVRGGEHGDHEDSLQQAHLHLTMCESCQTLLSTHKNVDQLLGALGPQKPSERSQDCPDEKTLYELAGGILDVQQQEEILKHVVDCNYCAPILRRASEDLADDILPEERALLGKLKSAEPSWQRTMARRLSSTRTVVVHGLRFWQILFSQRGLLIAGGFTVLIGVLTWIGLLLLRPTDPDQLLARAYSEKRTIEMRIGNVGHVPLRLEESGIKTNERMGRPALLKAEWDAARALQSTPDDPTWLEASGRTSLLEGDPGTAVVSLQKARQIDPNSTSIAIDLATAYFERGRTEKRPEDVGTAVDILGQVLAAHPESQIANFNYAIALEEVPLREQAVEAWNRYLHAYPNSDWAAEARERLGKLQKKMQEEKKRSGAPLEDMSGLVAALQSGGTEKVAAIDARIERYLTVVTEEWLPHSFRKDMPRDVVEWKALTAMAEILKSEHGDVWLSEVLNENPSSFDMADALGLVSEAQQAINVSDENRSIEAARRAEILFKRSNSLAGQLYAQFLNMYSNQLSHRSQDCEIAADKALSVPELRVFAWLQIQISLEAAICASTSDERAIRLSRDALKLATKHRYPILRSRAAKTLSGLEWAVGDQVGSWRTATEGLRDYWDGDLPPLLGYNYLTDLDALAEDNRQYFLQAAVLKESLPMIADNTDLVMRAFEQGRLAQALLMTGDLTGAETNFIVMRDLFDSSPPGYRKANVAAEAAIGLAEIDLRQGMPQRATERLEPIRSIVAKTKDDDLAFAFFKTFGIASMGSGNADAAEMNLRAAIQIAENGLYVVRNEQDRLRWARRCEPAYRAMVELKLKTDPLKSLGYWEFYKGASLRGPSRRPRDSFRNEFGQLSTPSESIGDNTAVVAYFISSHQTVVWVSDTSGTHTKSIEIPRSQLEIWAKRFGAHCADSRSSFAQIDQEGRRLYDEIVLPIEPWIHGHRLLIIEPDGDLKLVPFGALIDHSGGYVSDRYAIAISPGLAYRAGARHWAKIFASDRALVVGDPSVEGMSRLPDSEQEARHVASFFEHSDLLLQEDASYTNIAEGLQKVEVFHFSGHAVATQDSTGLLIAGPGLLDASKLQVAIGRRVQLVVLSACSTAHGGTGLFDDEDSLARMLIGQGVPVVVASRWAVDSAATAELMRGFYMHLLEGSRPSVSLLESIECVRQQEKYRHPYYWAGFSVFGQG